VSNNECDRILVLEQINKSTQYRMKKMCDKFDEVEERQKIILETIMKTKWAAYGAAGLLAINQLGLADILKIIAGN